MGYPPVPLWHLCHAQPFLAVLPHFRGFLVVIGIIAIMAQSALTTPHTLHKVIIHMPESIVPSNCEPISTSILFINFILSKSSG